MAKQKPLLFFAKTSKTLQLRIIKIVIEAFHQKEIVKPMEEEFLILLQECCEELKQALKGKGKDQNKDIDHITQVDKLCQLSIKNKRTKPSYQASKLRMRKNEAIKLRNDGMSWREMEKHFKMDHTTIQKEMKKWH
nr:hypothetical protein [Sulfurospirillum sp. 'SP']